MKVATGKPMKLQARWNGDPPKVGDYLMSKLKPRNAYRIVAVALRSKGRIELLVERTVPSKVPDGATVHGWQWESRDKVRTAWSGT